jgi:hypothetical protein
MSNNEMSNIMISVEARPQSRNIGSIEVTPEHPEAEGVWDVTQDASRKESSSTPKQRSQPAKMLETQHRSSCRAHEQSRELQEVKDGHVERRRSSRSG